MEKIEAIVDKIDLIIKGKPFAKQSTKFSKHGHAYTPKRVKDAEKNVKWQAVNQLPAGFKVWDCPIKVDYIVYVFPILKSMLKREKQAIIDGKLIYKAKRPDITDNLAKGLFDALEGVVYKDDSRIVELCHAKKIFGVEPMTRVGMSKIKQKVI